LFATLDPLTREIDLGENSKVLLTDTVGFIRKLPHNLVASFRATLEEVNEAGSPAARDRRESSGVGGAASGS
jgi:GTPase